MKAFTQWVLPLAIVALVVGGVQYMRHWTSTKVVRPKPVAPDDGPDAGPTSDPLEFPVKVVQADPEDPAYAGEYEVKGDHHYDFWFTNPEPRAVAVSLEAKSCTCTDVKLGTLTPADCRDWALLAAGDAARALAAPAGVDVLSAAALARLAAKPTWTQLLKGNAATGTVAAREGGMPLLGIVRFEFTAKEEGPKRLTGKVITQPEGVKWRAATSLELPIQVVPPLRSPELVFELGDLYPGTRREGAFVVWSSTRPALDLTAAAVQVDANATADPPRSLTDLECRELQAKLNRRASGEQSQGPTTRVRSAAVFPFAVAESKDGRQLDLGPLALRWKLEAKGQPEASMVVAARGMVRGDVRVVGGTDKNTIDLKAFSSRLGTDTNVLLTTTRDGVKLSLIGVEPDEAKGLVEPRLEGASASAGGPGQYKLWVKVPPNKAAGALPQQTAVVLQIEGTPRRVRIPVLGTAQGN